MAEEKEPIKIEADVLSKEPLNVIVEMKEKEKKDCEACFGISAAFLDFSKWIIGTIGLGIIGNLISNKYNNSQLAIEQLDADSKLITAVSAKFDTLASTQLNYMQYIKPFISTKSLILGVDSNIKRLNIEVKIQPQEAPKTAVNTAKQAVLQNLSSTEIDNFKKEANLDTGTASNKSTDKSINEIIQQENNILANNKNVIIPIDSKAISSIDAAYNIFTPKTITTPKKDSIEILVGNSQTLWCSKGYYVEFNNTLRIGINNLNSGNQTIIVNFKDIENGNESQIPVPESTDDTKTLNVGDPYNLYYNNYHYQITLNYIGAAGRNPFARAAYITVATYKKQ